MEILCLVQTKGGNAVNNIIDYVASNWKMETEYAGRMETFCFYCNTYQGERGDENKHKPDCVHIQAVKLVAERMPF